MNDLSLSKTTCVYGCKGERVVDELCCPACWRLIPRAFKCEFWYATKHASVGRGKYKNGRNTPRLQASIKAIIDLLILKVSKPYAESLRAATPADQPIDPKAS